jgi:transcriptional regulator with XRE-family HTH domain
MRERSALISDLMTNRESREVYIRSKLNVLLPSQIRSLRLRRGMKQSELGEAAEMKQARISAMEHIGEARFSIETLVRLAAAFCVGIEIRFVAFSEMLAWENEYQPESFDAISLEKDDDFIRPANKDSHRKIGEGILAAIIGDGDASNSSRPSQIGESDINNFVDSSERFSLPNQNGTSVGAAA